MDNRLDDAKEKQRTVPECHRCFDPQLFQTYHRSVRDEADGVRLFTIYLWSNFWGTALNVAWNISPD